MQRSERPEIWQGEQDKRLKERQTKNQKPKPKTKNQTKGRSSAL
jgi:hypothetical protein